MIGNSNYSLSISDLMMGLVFIFILILMKFMLNYHNKKHELEQPLMERSKLIEQLKTDMQKENIKATIDTEHGVLTLTDTYYFDQGEYKLSSEGRKSFKKIKKMFSILICYSNINSPKTKDRWSSSQEGKRNLKKWQDHCQKKYPDQYALIDSILIEGHADSTPISPHSFLREQGIHNNMDLAMKRAQFVFNFLLHYEEVTKEHSKESGNYLYALMNGQDKPLFGITSYGNLRRTDTGRDINSLSSKDQVKDRRIDFRFIMSQPEGLRKQRELIKAL